MCDKKIGPRVGDGEFFGNAVDTTRPGLEALGDAVRKQDYPAAKKLFAAYIRKSVDSEKYFDSIGMKKPAVLPEKVMEAADRVTEHRFVSCGIPHQFGRTVDWTYNPTYNKYEEWTWQLQRHHEWTALAKAYFYTGNEKYAECFAGLFDSWVKQALRPPEGTFGKDTDCWRTIECGIRMNRIWPTALHAFIHSAHFTDTLLLNWYKSVWEHGRRLRHEHMDGNWLVMEMNGLAHIGTLYPVFKESSDWRDYALATLLCELRKQVYPDGFQYELTSNYHRVVVNNFLTVMDLLKAYIPESGFYDAYGASLENMIHVYGKIMMPNGRVANINDGSWEFAASMITPCMRHFGKNEAFKWVQTTGQTGEKPSFCSTVFPYAGLAVFRTSWEQDALWCLFDAGPFGKAHQHEDKLSLLLYANRKLIVTEGGNYAYDDSKMREYVLTTASHNTVRVNGLNQNRRRDYAWKEEDISKASGMRYRLSEELDFAEGEYAEGYGPDALRLARHRRSVLFVKKSESGLDPFVLVIDRLYAPEERAYEILWHVDAEITEAAGMQVLADGLQILVPEAGRTTLRIIRGEEEPEWQGWVANSSVQGDYRPVFTLSYGMTGRDTRMVTLLYPYKERESPVAALEAGGDVKDTEIRILLKDGGVLEFDENQI